jgi:hypothetical protein
MWHFQQGSRIFIFFFLSPIAIGVRTEKGAKKRGRKRMGA